MSKYYLLLVFLISQNFQLMNAQGLAPIPETKRSEIYNELHGVKLYDPYQWLEDKADPEVVEWTRAQHERSENYIESLPEIPGLLEEIERYLNRDLTGPVFLRADRQFFQRKPSGTQQYKLYTIIDGEELMLFDPEEMDASGKTAISQLAFTEDAAVVAIGVQSAGDEILSYHLYNTRNGNPLNITVEGLRGFSFAKNSAYAYITRGTREEIEQQIPHKSYYHRLGTPGAQDIFLGAPKDPKYYVSFSDSKYSDLTFFYEGDFYANTVRIREVGSQDEFKEIYSSDKYRSFGEAINDKIYFLSNHEAPKFKLFVADKDKPEFANWSVLVDEDDAVLESFAVAQSHLLLLKRKDVLGELHLYTLDGEFEKVLETPELGSVTSINYHRESNSLMLSLATFTAPSKVYRLYLDDFRWELVHEEKAPISTGGLVAKTVYYPSQDGSLVPMFILHKEDLVLDGNNPTMLYGYGGFNVGIKPYYPGLMMTFINRGGIFAHAGIRGGDEYGESWHQDGMLFKKQNTFDDFIAAAEYLIQEEYTSADKLAIRGGSNGGLLVGAAMTQRPDLFQAVMCGVPLLDMIRFHKFLIARYWIPEYGDADSNADDFANLLSYSPYHNVRPYIDHPNVLITAGENDTRVDPLHAKKFAAALQQSPGQQNEVLLYIDYDSGHGSGKSIEQISRDFELKMRWVMNQLGMHEQSKD